MSGLGDSRGNVSGAGPRVQTDANAAVGADSAFGRYRLLRRLAVGGMAEIFLARSASVDGFEKDLVIKRMRPDLGSDEQFSSMFIDEARISISLTHPNVVQVFDFGKSEGSYFLAMEYVQGCDLDTLLGIRAVRDGGLDPGLALLIMDEVLKGLDYAHNKTDRQGRPLDVVHRDMSPANVLLSFDGSVKVADFGIARAEGCINPTKPGTVVGKLSYMAPEQAAGGDLDRRTDVFSCGIVLWEMLVGKPLRSGEMGSDFSQRLRLPEIPPPSAKNRNLDPALDALVMRALQVAPRQRYPTARDFGRAVHAYLVEHFPEASLYSLQSFMQAARPEINLLLRGDVEREPQTEDIEALTDRPTAAPAGTALLPLASGRGAIDWSPELIAQIEAFRRHPSLYSLIAMADICRREGQRQAALAIYRAAAVKFAQQGLLAPASLCARRMLDLASFTALRAEISALPSLAGRSNEHAEAHLFRSDGPVEQLLAELLADTNPAVGGRGQGTPLLSYLGGDGFADMLRRARLRHYDEGEHVVAQGEGGRTMFLIAEGRVLVHAVGSEGQKVYLSSLTAGDFFGENGFFTGAPRSATVEALYPCEVFEIDQVLYDEVMGNHAEASAILLRFYKERIVDTVLAKSPSFGLLAAEDRRHLIAAFDLRQFEAGEVVLQQGETDDTIYLIKDGWAEVFVQEGEASTVLSKLGPGTLFGEMAAVGHIPRTATVVATSRLETLVLAGAAFDALLASKPDIKSRILEVVEQRARDNVGKLMRPWP